MAIIEPAGTQSEWGAIAAQGLLASSGSGPYGAQAKVVAAALATTDNAATSARPELAAEAILHAATARRPKTRYPVGASARGILMLRHLLPDRVFDAVLWEATPRSGSPGRTAQIRYWV